MARHPWVAKADDGVRWGMQVVVPARRDALPKLMDVARQMETLGFDSLFVMDHPALHADPYIALSGAAAVTDKLHLGQLVMAATYRHPAFVARMQADLDNLSGGRSVLGVGSGWFEGEYRMMDLPFPAIGRRQKDLDELIECVDGLWSGKPFTHHGDTFTIDGMQIDPPPARRPPVLVGGSGKKGTMRQVATWGDACNVEEALKLNIPGATDAQRFEQVGEISPRSMGISTISGVRATKSSNPTSLPCWCLLRPRRRPTSAPMPSIPRSRRQLAPATMAVISWRPPLSTVRSPTTRVCAKPAPNTSSSRSTWTTRKPCSSSLMR